MKLQPYPKYKPSAVEWMGDVPEHWEVKSLTRITSNIRNGTSVTQLEDDVENAVLVTRIESISGGKVNFDKVGKVEWTPTLERYRLKKGDILLSHINSLLMVGNCAIFDSDRPLYSGMNLLRIEPEPTIQAHWLWRALASDGIRKEISARAKPAINQASVTTTQIKSLQLPVPSLSEQHSIAAFLERETGRIDRLVAKKRELIERLKEKRTALIARTVTRGLPPAVARAAGLLEKSPLKASGLHWLGDIPCHWGILPLKRVSQISYGIGGEIDRSLEEGLPTLSLPNIDFEGNLNLHDVPYAAVSEKEKRQVLLRKGDLLFNWRNGSSDHLGKTAYFDADGEYSHVSFLLRIRFNSKEYCSRFFRYLLAGYRVTGFFKYSKAGVNNTFNLSELSALPVMLPPLPEQTTIAAYLDEETAKLDALVAKVEEAIERLQEYRTALITAAVTGKIDVREEVAL
jgi:type I restriction enzyme S subunit